MNSNFIAAALMAKATRACSSAILLLAADDVDGACNRAYYAMFDAARAALSVTAPPVVGDVARSHSGLIAAFGLHLVKNGRLPAELGRMLNRAEEIRLIADYRGESIEPSDAHDMIVQAREFVDTIATVFFPD